MQKKSDPNWKSMQKVFFLIRSLILMFFFSQEYIAGNVKFEHLFRFHRHLAGIKNTLGKALEWN